jgi:predicted nucleic acid-binding Zn ribbon protein
MYRSKDNSTIKKNNVLTRCYNCDSELINPNQKYCENCNAILNPNDLKWRNSFIAFICLLCLIPLIIVVGINLM